MELGVPLHSYSHSMKYDAAITGGGISGLALAIDLARQGLKTIVFERGNYPRHKVCGEYLSLESSDYLSRICPQLKGKELPVINKFRFTVPGDLSFTTALPVGGIGISRYMLEHMLYEEAKRSGAEFRTNTKVNAVKYNIANRSFEIKSESGNAEASLVCVATGKRSNLEPAKAERSRYIAVKYHIEHERDKDTIEIHSFPGGYCGISEIEDGKSCLCYIVNSAKLKEARFSIKQMENIFLRRNKSIARIFDLAKFLYEKPLTISGIDFKIKNSTSNNALFIGDAAGSIAPITGNGMSMGLRSASYLGKHIPQFISGHITRDDLNKGYTEFWNNEFSSRIKFSRTLQRLSESPLLAKVTIKMFNRFPSLAQSMIAQTTGEPF